MAIEMPLLGSSAAAAPHLLSAAEAAARHEVEPHAGLTDAQAAERRVRYGPNRLPEAPPRSAASVFFAQFKSVLILMLIGAALLAALIGQIKDMAVIIAVVLINAVVGFYQEYRAEHSLAALKEMSPHRARARRGGKDQSVVAENLVPGDIVLLEAGDRVPADGRLLTAADAEVDESALTGESQPVRKQTGALTAPDAPPADRSNMAYMNTMLTRGRAELLVTATGVHTELGRLSLALAAAEEVRTPLQVQLDRLGKRLGAIALTLVGVLSFLQLLRGADLAHIVLDAIALSVAAMPEGLPVVVTVTLALGMHKMARLHAIVKKMASVETLGSTTVICSDKTGTLTLNRMSVRALYCGGERFDAPDLSDTSRATRAPREAGAADMRSAGADCMPLLTAIVACNDSRIDGGKTIGDPMEAALLAPAERHGVTRAAVQQQLPRIAEIPFDSAHKYMATFHRGGGEVRLFVKGAPDALLARCERELRADGARPLDASAREQIDREYERLARNGLRGLLVAERSVAADAFDPSGDLAAWVEGLTFVGLVGLADPPRPEAKEAIAQCAHAGIAVKMITGDHKSTGIAIARELGLGTRALTGAELDAMDPARLAAVIDEVAVFARVTAAHKVKIVRALQAKGHVVAMTGDGVNDAPALRGADIGVAMGTVGTAVAKQAATMVLTDDNFATIVSAVRQGRVLYDNIVKFVRFQLSTTVGAILTFFFAPLAGLPEPFTPIQVLWVAIIMDGPPAVSLALDAARPGIMAEPPRNRDSSVLPPARITKILAFGITMMVGTLAALHYGLQGGTEQRALTLAFTTFVLFQVFNVFNARVEEGSAFNTGFFANPMLWISLAGVVGLQIAAVHWPPAQAVVATEALSAADWGTATAIASSVLLLEEGRKLALALLARVAPLCLRKRE